MSYKGIDDCGPYGKSTAVDLCFEDPNLDPGCPKFSEWHICKGNEIQQKVVYGDDKTTVIPINKFEMGGCKYSYLAVYTCGDRGISLLSL